MRTVREVPTAIDVRELSRRFGSFVAVKDFDLNLAEGEFVSLIGHSGCGKSTVLSMVAGLMGKNGGAIILDNKEVRGAGPDRAVVFQSPCLLPWFDAMENVLLGIEQVFPTAPRSQRRCTRSCCSAGCRRRSSC